MIRAAAEMAALHPDMRSKLQIVICGGPSGTGLARPAALEDLADELGIRDLVTFVPPQDRENLINWYRAADVCVVPSHNESFGLVAVEAQACGLPVVAARVGGLPTAVADGVSGQLVDGHDPRVWALVLCDLLLDTPRRQAYARGAIEHAASFGWDATAEATVEVYQRALNDRASVAEITSAP